MTTGALASAPAPSRVAEPAAEAPRPAAHEQAAAPDPEPPLTSARILMVDDEPTTLDVLEMYLEEAGYRQLVATDEPATVMGLLEAEPPDVLLLDLMMPVVSGFDILAMVRSERRFAHLPVVILTSSTDSEVKLRALGLGATEFLSKPVDPSELVLRLQNILSVKAYQDRIRAERENSERLLLNILPEPVAERLKRGEQTIADQFEEATVLFADLVNFTEFAAGTDAVTLVGRLNEVFQAFDELVGERGLEKIKTSGDAYMLVGGVPVPRADHADAVVEAGLAMIEALARLGGREHRFALRVGVHTGPLVAGVIGFSKFSYDVWGDTVNVASRMESHGVAGCIQVSEDTRRRLSERFVCEPRGPVSIKGKGTMSTFLVRG